MKIKALDRIHDIRLCALKANYADIDKKQYRDLQAGKSITVDKDIGDKLINAGYCIEVKEKKIINYERIE